MGTWRRTSWRPWGFVDVEGLIHVQVAGYVTAFELARVLGGCARPRQGGRLLVDCSEMVDYSHDARQLFIDWNRAHRKDLEAVAVVSDQTRWQLVVPTMALASGQRMRAFSRRSAALSWLSEVADLPTERSRKRSA